MIDRRRHIEHICHLLQNDYVALLGQTGTGISTLVESIADRKSSRPGMVFVSVALPRGIVKDDEFKELFLEQLCECAVLLPPDDLVHQVEATMEKHRKRTVDFRLRMALKTIGKESSAKRVIIVLHAIDSVHDASLKNLLLLLREFHEQRNSRVQAGAKLRFLVCGDFGLWKLCFSGTDERSPFNIASRVFLDGLSHDEIRELDKSEQAEAAMKIRNLTDGVPSLVQLAVAGSEDYEDLTAFFGALQDNWNLLKPKAQSKLVDLAEGAETFPKITPDFKCPVIPKTAAPWADIFWAGFLRVRHRELTWRSPIHRAFVIEQSGCDEETTRTSVLKVDLSERARLLENAVREHDDVDAECIEEAYQLTVETDGIELLPVFEMAKRGEDEDTIAEEVKEVAKKSACRWIRSLGEKVDEHRGAVLGLVVSAVVAGAKNLFGQP